MLLRDHVVVSNPLVGPYLVAGGKVAFGGGTVNSLGNVFGILTGGSRYAMDII